VLRAIADRHELKDGAGGLVPASIANVAVRWVLEQTAVAAVTIGLRKLGTQAEREKLQTENELALNFALSSRDHAEIDSVLEGLAPLPGDCGDEYRMTPCLVSAFSEQPRQLEGLPLAYKASLALSNSAPPPSVPRLRIDYNDASGVSRAVRVGSRVIVSGTKSMRPDGRLAGGGDAAAQTTYVLDLVEASLRALGASLDDVVQTRLFVCHVQRDSAAVSRVHGRRFGALQRLPASTLVGAELAGKGYLIEVEAEAIIGEDEYQGPRLPGWHAARAEAHSVLVPAGAANAEAQQQAAKDFDHDFAATREYFRSARST